MKAPRQCGEEQRAAVNPILEADERNCRAELNSHTSRARPLAASHSSRSRKLSRSTWRTLVRVVDTEEWGDL